VRAEDERSSALAGGDDGSPKRFVVVLVEV
jgi:hypothetical protein